MKHLMGADTRFIWHKETSLEGVDLLLIPGGFSYGDYLRTGAIARFSPVMQEVMKFAEEGRPVLGICNGFQILLEAGLLPGAMLHNEKLRFVCKNVFIRVENSNSPYTAGLEEGDILEVPVSHGEGNYFIDEEGLKSLQDNRQILFSYCDRIGEMTTVANVIGSVVHIAGFSLRKEIVIGVIDIYECAMEM